MSEEVSAKINFVLGDRGGIRAADDVRALIAATRKELDAAKRAGGLEAVAGGEAALRRANATLEKTGFALAEVTAQAERARRELAAVEVGTDEWRRLTKEILNAEEAAARFSGEIARLPGQVGGAARGVGEDVVGRGETALAATAGLAGGLGFGGGGLMLGADILGFADAMKGLKEQLPGITKGFGGLTKGALTSGAALGAAGLALGVLALSVKSFMDSANKQAEQLKSALQAAADVERALAEGMTSAEAQDRIKAIEAQLEAEKRILAEREAAYDQFEEEAGGALAAIAKVISPQEQALSDAIKESESAIQGLQTELSNWNSALDEGRTAAADAAAEEEKLAQARAKAASETIAAWQAEAQTAAAREQELTSITEEGAREQIAATEAQQRAQGALAAKLAQAARAAEEGSAEQQQYLTALQQVRSTQAALTSDWLHYSTQALAAGKANDKAAASAELLAERTEKAAQLQEELSQQINEARAATEQWVDSMRAQRAALYEEIEAGWQRHQAELDELRATARQRLEIMRSARRDIVAEERALGQSRTEILREAREREADIARDRAYREYEFALDLARDLERLEVEHQRELIEIKRQAIAEEQDLIAARDFAGLMRLRRDLRLQAQDRETALAQERQDLLNRYQFERDARAREADQERAERARQTQQAAREARTGGGARGGARGVTTPLRAGGGAVTREHLREMGIQTISLTPQGVAASGIPHIPLTPAGVAASGIPRIPLVPGAGLMSLQNRPTVTSNTANLTQNISGAASPQLTAAAVQQATLEVLQRIMS